MRRWKRFLGRQYDQDILGLRTASLSKLMLAYAVQGLVLRLAVLFLFFFCFSGAPIRACYACPGRPRANPADGRPSFWAHSSPACLAPGRGESNRRPAGAVGMLCEDRREQPRGPWSAQREMRTDRWAAECSQRPGPKRDGLTVWDRLGGCGEGVEDDWLAGTPLWHGIYGGMSWPSAAVKAAELITP